MLIQDTKKAKDILQWQKLQLKWQGPLRIKKALEKGYYRLKDPNSTKIKGTLYRNRPKRFYIKNPKKIKLEDRINRSSYNIEEVFIEEEVPKEEAVV